MLLNYRDELLLILQCDIKIRFGYLIDLFKKLGFLQYILIHIYVLFLACYLFFVVYNSPRH